MRARFGIAFGDRSALWHSLAKTSRRCSPLLGNCCPLHGQAFLPKRQKHCCPFWASVSVRDAKPVVQLSLNNPITKEVLPWPRKSKYITQFFNRDRLAFTALSKVGHVSHDHLRSCGLADSRIKNLLRDGHIEKVAYKRAGKIEECYKLTKSGRDTANRLWGLERAYHAQSPSHDLALAEKYFSLPESLREHWKTENQARDQFQEELNVLRDQGKEAEAKMYEDMLARGLISMPDAVYTNEGGIEIAFEVVTNTYGQDELRAKEAFVEFMNLQYETTRI